MRALIACEYSGIVREAFATLGWDAWSCDYLPTEKPGNHYQGDILNIIYTENWDLLIGFPPCTYLTFAGMANWEDEGRAMKRIEAAKFFMQLYEAPIQRVCIENPRGIMSNIFRKPDMEIHPYFFGDSAMKRTNLWLKGLPKLHFSLEPDLFSSPTTGVEKPKPIQIQRNKKTGVIKKRHFTDAINTPRWMNGKERSRFFPV